MILPEVPQKMSDKNLRLYVIEIPPQAGPEAKHKSLPFNVVHKPWTKPEGLEGDAVNVGLVLTAEPVRIKHKWIRPILRIKV